MRLDFSQPRYFPDQRPWQSALVGVLVLGGCIIGIGTRLLFDLASFWPANALLFSIFATCRHTNRPLTWLTALGAYLFADFLAGTAFVTSLWLTAANLAGVSAGLLALWLLPLDILNLRRPADAIFAILALATAALGAALVGTVAGPLLFRLSPLDSALLWFSTELVNYAILFPVALTLVQTWTSSAQWRRHRLDVSWPQLLALLSLALAIAVMQGLGGPGAISFVLPILLWCSVRFRPFATALLTLGACTWMLVAGQAGMIPLHFALDNALTTSSFRLGVGMIAIVPFAVSCLAAGWRELNAALLQAATHDGLTGLKNRGAFMTCAGQMLRSVSPDAPFTLLMIDIDHFKAVNDTHGHAAGDEALRAIALRVARHVRQADLVGRLGGEEFAVAMPGANSMVAEMVAERVRHAVQGEAIGLEDGSTLRLSVSIGVASAVAQEPLRELMSAADSALYAAKHGGRNRVVMVSKDQPALVPRQRAGRG